MLIEKDPAKKVSVSIRQSQLEKFEKSAPNTYRGNFSRFVQDALDHFSSVLEKEQTKKSA